MKILIVTDAYFPQVNGVVRTLNETGKKLKALPNIIEESVPFNLEADSLMHVF